MIYDHLGYLSCQGQDTGLRMCQQTHLPQPPPMPPLAKYGSIKEVTQCRNDVLFYMSNHDISLCQHHSKGYSLVVMADIDRGRTDKTLESNILVNYYFFVCKYFAYMRLDEKKIEKNLAGNPPFYARNAQFLA